MKYVICAVTALYGLLCIVAAATQLKNAGKKDSPAMMLGGGALLLLAAALQLFAWSYDWIIAVLGGAMICIAAFLNGRRGGNFHLLHHIIRLAVTALLVAGFILL